MTLEKAIEIVAEAVKLTDFAPDPDFIDATRLLIEAGRREQFNRKDIAYLITGTLPGETKD